LFNIAIVFMVLIILIMIFAPFFIKQTQQQLPLVESEWEQQKEQIFVQLSDLEYDYQMKKITDPDYETLKAELTTKAVHYVHLQEPDAEQIEKLVDEEIKQYAAGISSKKKGGAAL
jgi:biopolymer transport protein ExbD